MKIFEKKGRFRTEKEDFNQKRYVLDRKTIILTKRIDFGKKSYLLDKIR